MTQQAMTHFDGTADPARREALDQGAEETVREGWAEYRKSTTTWARKMSTAFTVETLEGVMSGEKGDYLAVGVAGEMYPIRAHIFEQSFERVDEG